MCIPIVADDFQAPLGVLYLQGGCGQEVFSSEARESAETFAHHLARLARQLLDRLATRDRPDPTAVHRKALELDGLEGTGPLQEDGSIVFHDGGSSFTILWSDLELGGAFAVPGLVFGNNSANRIPEITAASVGLTQFDRIVINMGGSGGIDNRKGAGASTPCSTRCSSRWPSVLPRSS